MFRKAFVILILSCAVAWSAEPDATAKTTGGATNSRPDYVLTPSDVVHVRVYQEDDLEAKVRVSNDGTIVLALLGPVRVGGKTREQAAKEIRDLLAEKYLVSPQVTIEITEYSKRRFTVLGHVQRPGTYEMPGDESVNLLQAISMAGGYARLGTGRGVTVQRGQGENKQIFKQDADSMAKEKNVKIFEILPDDVITVGEKLF